MSVHHGNNFIQPAAIQQFHDWACKAERDGHLNSGQARHIVEMFTNAIQASDPLSYLDHRTTAHVRDHKITPGNKSHIMRKAGEILTSQSPSGYRGPAPDRYSPYSPVHRGKASDAPAPEAVSQGAPECVPPPAASAPEPLISTIQSLARQDGYIWFYKSPENVLTEIFGNFYEVPGRVFGCRTSEGAFQAQKFVGNPFARFAELDGDGAWRLGRSFPGQQKAGWHQGEKVKAMRSVLAEKFKSGSFCARALLATGSAYLVEHNPVKGRDAFWSDDYDGTGQNMLGRLLMEQRESLGGCGIVPKPATLVHATLR